MKAPSRGRCVSNQQGSGERVKRNMIEHVKQYGGFPVHVLRSRGLVQLRLHFAHLDHGLSHSPALVHSNQPTLLFLHVMLEREAATPPPAR